MRTPILVLIALLLSAFALSACNLTDTSGDAGEESETSLTTATIEGEADRPSATPTVTLTGIPTALPTTGASSAPTAILPPAIPTATTSAVGGSLGAPQLAAPGGAREVYALRLDGSLSGGGLSLFNNLDIRHFSQNPASTNRYAVIDSSGMLYITSPGGAEAFRVEQGPYTQFPAQSLETNNAAATMSAWSPNGQYVAFIVAARQQAADGVWFFQPGEFAPLELVVDCPFTGFIGCNIVRPPDNFRTWTSQDLYWSPDSQTLLIRVDLPDAGRGGLIRIGVTRNERVRDERPPIILYDYGTYTASGQIIASGRRPDGSIGVDRLGADGTPQATLYSAPAGQWVGWAAEHASGEIVMLGRSGGADGPVALMGTDGTVLTGPIGNSFPSRVRWSPDRRAVLVEAGGRVYVASPDGQIVDVTASAGQVAVNWVAP